MGEIDKPTYPTPMDMIEMWLNLDARDDAERLKRIKVLRRAIADERADERRLIGTALDEVLSNYRMRLPGRGGEEDVGFDSEWEALDDLHAIVDAGGPQEDV